ncbi:MAG: hypothetical protein QOG76_4727 [Pseudonocardiales bacterium]|jgi:hypothetical protein|nr:hypothetical protein [Pseudonocardiales bacterium]
MLGTTLERIKAVAEASPARADSGAGSLTSAY